MKSMLLGGLAALALTAFASSASATIQPVTFGPPGSDGSLSGTFGDTGITTTTFTDTFTFTLPSAGTAGATISSTSTSGTTNLSFTTNNGTISTVTFDGTPFQIGSTGVVEFQFFGPQGGEAGGTHTIVVNGTVASPGSSASYAGTVSFTPAPEPATWALMIAGVGLAGVALRRRRQLSLVQA